MLTLKSPLQLQCATPVTTYHDQLSKKIIGNYQLMSLSIKAQDLLYMTMQEPEIYVAMGNEQMTVVDQKIINQNSERLEAVNQFFNRIMLFPSTMFTYQDEIYVTTILQKLGITDVASFMKQVQENLTRNEVTQRLVNQYFAQGDTIKKEMSAFAKYQKEISFIASSLSRFQQINEESFMKEMLQHFEKKESFETFLEQYFNREEIDQQTKAEFYEQYHNYQKQTSMQEQEIHNNNYLQDIVFTHLHTAQAANTVYDYHKVSFRENMISKEQAKLLPQIKQADVIHLYKLRQYLLQQKQSPIWVSHNQYENTNMSSEELTQEKVTQYLSAAVLSDLVQLLSYDLENQVKNQAVWMDFSKAFYENSLDTIQRLESNQLEEHIDQVDLHLYADYSKQLYEDEAALLDIMQQINLHEMAFQNAAEETVMKQNTILALLENQNLQNQLEENLHFHRNATQLEEKVQYNQQENQFLQFLRQQAESYTMLQEYTQKQMHNLWQAETNENIAVSTVHHNQQIDQIAVSDNQYENTEENSSQSFVMQDIKNIQVQDTYNQEAYISYLEKINEQNVKMQKLLSEQNVSIEKNQKVVVDKKYARENVLKALENPQEVLQEIYQNATGISASLPPGIEKLLHYTDEKTRKLYEKILGIAYKDGNDHLQIIETDAKTVERAISELTLAPEKVRIENHRENKEFVNILKEITTSLQEVLNHQQTLRIEDSHTFFETKQTERIKPVEMEELKETTVSLIKAPLQKVEEKIAAYQLPAKVVVQEQAVALIHQKKDQVQEEMVEEVLEKLQKNTNTVTQEVTVEQTEQVITKQIQKTKKEILSENEEIIEKILHNNLQTQLHVISDQVYQDIERRLQSERRRRGY